MDCLSLYWTFQYSVSEIIVGGRVTDWLDCSQGLLYLSVSPALHQLLLVQRAGLLIFTWFGIDSLVLLVEFQPRPLDPVDLSSTCFPLESSAVPLGARTVPLWPICLAVSPHPFVCVLLFLVGRLFLFPTVPPFLLCVLVFVFV